MSNFWSGYITILSLGSILALTWLIFATRKGQRQRNTNETIGHSFDGIEEYDNPLPKWWFLLFVGTIIFALVYLALYPGLGNWKGLLPGYEYLDNQAKTSFAAQGETTESNRTAGWTSVRQWEKEMQQADKKYDPIYTKYRTIPIDVIAKDDQALKIGGRLFANYCSTCHGSDAKGSYGFPNLTDNEWRWGGEPETIMNTIMNGRIAIMPPQGPIIGEDGVQNVAAYVLTELAGRELPPGINADIPAGKAIFDTVCMTCHTQKGTGMTALGTPDLTAPNAFIYGSSYTQLQQTIRYGRSGQMPAQQEFLGADKVYLLAAYVYSLSHKGKRK